MNEVSSNSSVSDGGKTTSLGPGASVGSIKCPFAGRRVQSHKLILLLPPKNENEAQ